MISIRDFSKDDEEDGGLFVGIIYFVRLVSRTPKSLIYLLPRLLVELESVIPPTLGEETFPGASVTLTRDLQ